VDIRVLLVLAVAALVMWALAGGALREPERHPEVSSAAPVITSIEFPKEIEADGEDVTGTVEFFDPDGDIIEARFEVVEAVLFESFSFNPQVEGVKEGEFEFVVFSFIPQRITLRVTLVDRAGHESRPVEFTFEALASF